MAGNETSSQTQPIYNEIARLVPLSLAIVVTNALVIVLFLRRKYLRTLSNFPLVSLAVCDFITGSVNIPLFIITFLTSAIRSQEVIFYLRCLVFVLHTLTATATVYHILVVVGEKYFAIVWPWKHRLLTRKVVFRVITTVWFVSLIIAFTPFSWIKVSDMKVKAHLLLGYSIVCLFAVFVLSYLFIIYALVVMFRVISGKSGQKQPVLLRRNSRSFETNRQRRRVCTIFAAMATVFAVCWLPWYMMVLLVNMKVDIKNFDSYLQWFATLRYVTCIVNPLLYTFFKPDFRRAFKEVLWNKIACRHSSISQMNISWRKGVVRLKGVRTQSSNSKALSLRVNHELPSNSVKLQEATIVSSV